MRLLGLGRLAFLVCLLAAPFGSWSSCKTWDQTNVWRNRSRIRRLR